jgi:hypothetical protein
VQVLDGKKFAWADEVGRAFIAGDWELSLDTCRTAFDNSIGSRAWKAISLDRPQEYASRSG